MAILAAIPVVNGGLYSRTRLFEASATNKFPLESKAASPGPRSPAAVDAAALLVRLGWPSATLALIPVENGGLNSSVRLLPPSTTQRFPPASKLTPKGSESVLAFGLPVSLLPSITAALWSLENGGTNSSTRLLV